MNLKLPSPLRGIIVPLVTPLSDRDTIDIEGLEKLVNHVIEGGVAGIFILGTTGEGPALSYRLREEMIERVCALVDGRVPVLVGITDTAFVETVNVANFAADKGAAGVVIAPPYYFAMEQHELLGYLLRLVPQLPLPVFLYNMPSHTKVFMQPETVRQAARIPGIVGLKDSSGNMVYFHKLLKIFRDNPDFSLLVGPEELLAESISAGAHGGVNGGANLVPSLYVDMYNKASKDDKAGVKILQKKIMDISVAVYDVCKSGSSYLKGLKCALNLAGICSDVMAEPFGKSEPAERTQIKQNMTEIGLIKPTDGAKTTKAEPYGQKIISIG